MLKAPCSSLRRAILFFILMPMKKIILAMQLVKHIVIVLTSNTYYISSNIL